MKNKKKIIFIEPHMDGPRGHHMDSLIAKSVALRKYGKICWIVSNKYKQRQADIPKHVKIINVLDTAKRGIFFFNIKNTVNTFFLILKNFFLSAVIIFQLLRRREFSWIYPFFYNFCSFPKYLPSIFSSFENLQVNQNDQIIFNSCSDLNDYELAFFLYFYKKNPPAFHMLIRSLPKFQKKKIKTPIYFLKKININEKNNFKKKFFLYAETEKNKSIIFKNYRIAINLFHDCYFFSTKTRVTKKINIGFFGEARANKGFEKYLSLIKEGHKLDNGLNFTIQFSSVPNEFVGTKKEILKYIKKNKTVKCIPKYISYTKYRKFLTTIDIAPIMYDHALLDQVGSGVVFSCIANEIPMIIPSNSSIKKKFKHNCYLEAVDIKDYAKKIIEIQKNYTYFLQESKKEAKYLQEKFHSYPFLDRIKKIT